jgi:hypothetical protein
MAIGGFDLASYSLKSLFHRVVFSPAMENTKEEDKKSWNKMQISKRY